MGSKPPNRGRLDGSHQSAMLTMNFPSFRQIQRGNPFVWVGNIQPSTISTVYKVRITFTHGTNRPRVEVIDPPLESRDVGIRIPHTFPDGSLCLHMPGEWSSSQPIHRTVIPWTSTWLYYYEIWRITGEWLGGGHESQQPKIQK